jgi:hypothetical protein
MQTQLNISTGFYGFFTLTIFLLYPLITSQIKPVKITSLIGSALEAVCNACIIKLECCGCLTQTLFQSISGVQ